MKKYLLVLVSLSVSALFASDGATLYKTCTACHGEKGEKAALNKSQIIQGWKSDKTIMALKGYKEGTYGGALKGTMAAQVKNLDETAMGVLAKHIESLK